MKNIDYRKWIFKLRNQLSVARAEQSELATQNEALKRERDALRRDNKELWQLLAKNAELLKGSAQNAQRLSEVVGALLNNKKLD